MKNLFSVLSLATAQRMLSRTLRWMFRFDTPGQIALSLLRGALALLVLALFVFYAYGRSAMAFYKPHPMTTLSGKTTTQCVGRYLLDTPVEFGTFGISSAEFTYGLTPDFKTVALEVKHEDYTPQTFFEETKSRIQTLKQTPHDRLPISLLLAQEVWETPNGNVLMLRYLADETMEISTVKSEVHILVGSRYAVISGESFLEEERKNETTDQARYKYIDTKPVEARLKTVAQNIKGYRDVTKAPEGFCVAGVVMNEKTMGYDVERADLFIHDPAQRVPHLLLNVDMTGQFLASGPDLHARAEETLLQLRPLLALEGGQIHTLRWGKRGINGMPSLEYAHAMFFKGLVSFKFMAENVLPKAQRSLLRPNIAVSLDFGDQEKPAAVSESQALDIWDAMLNSLRLSPANGGVRVDGQTGALTPTTRVGEVCPRSGVWEATLPVSHHAAQHIASLPERFKQVRVGAPMPELFAGYTYRNPKDADIDNAAVTWTLVRPG